MLRPTTLLRATIALPRQLLPQRTTTPSLSSVLLSRRYLSTTPNPTPEETTSLQTSTAEKPQPTKRPRPTNLPFRVSRTPGNNLPVYELAKRGGNKKLTTIKKIEGDRMVFKEKLAEGLGLDLKKVAINSLTGHVTVQVRCATRPGAW